MTTGPRSDGNTRGRIQPNERCVVSARYTDHEGPVYGGVEGVIDGMAMVRYPDGAGMDQIAEIPMARLASGADVERQMLNGRPAEFLYRCFFAPVEDGEVSVWRMCQVERTDENDEGGYQLQYRPKGHEGLLMSSSIVDFQATTLRVCKEDFLLDVGDWTQSDVTMDDLQDGMDATDRGEIWSGQVRN